MAQRLKQVLHAFIQPYIDYGLSGWGNTSGLNIKKEQCLQSRAAHVLTNNFNYEVSSHSNISMLEDFLCNIGEVFIFEHGFYISAQKHVRMLL